MTSAPPLDDLTALRAQVVRLVSPQHPHEGDCANSLCVECGHCMHSFDECDHECEPGGGCMASSDETTSLVRAVLGVLDEVRAARTALTRVRAAAQHGIDKQTYIFGGLYPLVDAREIIDALEGRESRTA